MKMLQAITDVCGGGLDKALSVGRENTSGARGCRQSSMGIQG